jgi:hypothetical protein
VLPGKRNCGNGVREPEEQCDVDSPGCVSCKEARGYRCRDNVCNEFCGDGIVVGGEECDPPDGKACDTSCRKSVAREEPCSLAGHWILRQTDFSVASVGTKGLQASTNWFYWEVEQDGDKWAVKNGLFCGIVVTGSVNVRLADSSTRALMHENFQGASNTHGGRTGTMREEGEGCYLDTSRFYFVRGGSDALLPANFADAPALETLPPLPSSNDLYDASKGGDLAQATDPENDGIPGVNYEVTGLVNGVRSVTQRDWSEYATDATHAIAQFAPEFVARSDFRNQEKILHVTCAAGGQCPLLEAGSQPSLDKPGRVLFRYIGGSLDAARASGIVVGTPGEDEVMDFETCKNIQKQIPHDPSSE